MKWILLIEDELTTMIKKNVLSPFSEKDEHQVDRPLGMRWVLNIKDNGRCRDWLVSKVFLQI